MNIFDEIRRVWWRFLNLVGLCPSCGIRRHHGEWCCDKCYAEMTEDNL